ncbi:MAG: response regulator [Clostridia bacterium]|nr:response regulator [Clostridia bacterium]
MLDSSVVFVGRDGMNFDVNSDLIVALPSGFINGEQVVNAQYPNFKFYHGTSNEDCLKAIRDKKADVMLQNMYIIRECLQSPLYEGIAIFPAFSFPEEEKIIALPEDKLLMSIINKSIKMITQDETNDIVINHTIGKGYHADFKEILYKYRFPLIGVVILLIALFSLLIIISGIRQRNLKAIEKVNKKLETAVIQADRANNAKSQFLSRMSHEIRTPMNAIVGLTEIAKRYEEDPHKIDDYLDKISISSKVLLNIINDVLDMSAIENNKLKIINEEFDIKQILSSISTIYYAQCKSKEIHFDMIADIQNEYLRGDALRVSQILLNLVSNAYKFTKSGGKISIIIRETECHNEKAVLQFVVSDTGCGMTDDMKSRIFKPFEQESANTAKEHGGSGLGLSIAKNLISMMGGTISLESEKDKGTTFTVELTFAVVKPAEAEKNTSDEQKIADLHILVVDDDKKTSAYTSTILSRLGVSFETAQSGDEALSMLKTKRDEHPFSLCLINWEMADMNGAYVLKQIRDDQENEKMKVIILSYDANEIQDEAAGADCFVSKPLFQSTLQNALLTMMNSEYAENKTANTQYDFTGHRILLAEDQPLNAEIAIALLAMVNMESDHAENGRIAVRKFCDAPPGTYDVILMDMQMPELNGYEATKEIRALDRPDAKEIPIYAMTAEAFTEDIEAALKAGMNGHIAKPIDTKVLYETLKKEIILKDLHQKEGDL